MVDTDAAHRLWSRGNLHAWEIANWDLTRRTPVERAQLLHDAGIGHYAYLPSTDPENSRSDFSDSHEDIHREIEAMLDRGIRIRAWFFWINRDDPADEPAVARALAAFDQYDLHPQIWVAPSYGRSQPEPMSIENVQHRLAWEAGRIAAFVDLARPHGCQVHVYGHYAWMGRTANLLALLDRLRERGLENVGMVYNLPHTRAWNGFPDDAERFPEIWARIQKHVVAVNAEFGDPFRARDMVRTITESGWTGAVGTFTVGYGDAELVLRNALHCLDWSLTS